MRKAKVYITRNARELAEFLGLSPADGAEMEFRVTLLGSIIGLAKKSGLTHAQIARLAGTSRPRVTNLLNRNIGDISTDLMLRVLAALGYRVDCKISKAA